MNETVRLFGGVYQGRRVLVTGHTGFKGSWLTMWLQAMGASVHGFALEAESAPNHADLLGLPPASTVADLRDRAAVFRAVEASNPEIVFHLGAQALVKRGYVAPHETFATNVMGLVNLLDAVRDCPATRAVVVVTSDKCYRNDGGAGAFRESDPLGGHDPYSASKACAEIVAASYRASYFGRETLIATARAGNVIGGGDWAADRLVPDLVRGAASGVESAVRAPHAVRPWQHVLEPLAGYLLLGERLLGGGDAGIHAATEWNFGPDAEGHRRVGELVDAMSRVWPAVRTVRDRAIHPHEAATLRLDCARASETLGWHPVWDFDAMIERTASWYRAFHEDGRVRSFEDLLHFVHCARARGQAWANPDAAAPRPLMRTA